MFGQFVVKRTKHFTVSRRVHVRFRIIAKRCQTALCKFREGAFLGCCHFAKCALQRLLPILRLLGKRDRCRRLARRLGSSRSSLSGGCAPASTSTTTTTTGSPPSAAVTPASISTTTTWSCAGTCRCGARRGLSSLRRRRSRRFSSHWS